MGDYRTTSGEAPPVTRKAARRRKLIIVAVLVTVLGTVVAAGILIRVERYTSAKGYVTTEEFAEVRPTTTGVVSAVLASTGDSVEAGALLVKLDDSEEQAALEEARARASKSEVLLEHRKAQMANDIERRRVLLEEQKRNHQDAIQIARLRLRDAESKLALTEQLVKQGLKAKNALEDDQLRLELVQAELTSLLAKDLTIHDALLAKDEATYQTELAAMTQEHRALGDAVRRAEARCRAKEIRAPIAGRLNRYEFWMGELVRPENVLFEIYGGERQILKLQVSERFATKVAPGQRYSALLAPYSGMNRIYFKGQVEYMRKVIQSEGKSTYRKAYCDFDAQGRDIPPGTTAEARIYYGTSCLWFYLFNIDL